VIAGIPGGSLVPEDAVWLAFVFLQKSRDKWAEICFTSCMASRPKIPKIPEEQRTPLVLALLEIIQYQQEQIQELRDEISRLKGQKPKPKIRPSALEKERVNQDKETGLPKRPGSAKRNKAPTIHETVILRALDVPKGSAFKGYEDFTVQGLVLRPHNTLYRRQRWITRDGESIVAPLPGHVTAHGGHFDASLQRFILYQYHHCHVTQPLLLEQLRELGVDISAGQVNRIITEGNEYFHREKDEILRVGLQASTHVNVDDTGARHKGENGYCTHIGNEMFAWFQSTAHKSRMNFLELLRAGADDYVLNNDALEYMKDQKLPKAQIERLIKAGKIVCEDRAAWNDTLESLGITAGRHVRIATEGAVLGSVLEHDRLNGDLVIISDDAGQFDILVHALCWIHAERSIGKLVGFNDAQREAVAEVRGKIWEFYRDLKTHQAKPDAQTRTELEERFDQIFTTRTCYAMLNQALDRIHKKKGELLHVLERPDIPLHNNSSERDIREYVKKRKISGSTRSDPGRRCRDTFASLKKTCRKLGVGFWDYLEDRLCGANCIPWLPDLLKQRLAASLQ
jgi:hypothetical protein